MEHVRILEDASKDFDVTLEKICPGCLLLKLNIKYDI
jgi:hypothetical protein